jgi:alpha-galactosidase
MTKITFIGAGSLGFTGELVRDILTFPLLEDTTISLMDIHEGRLEWAKRGVEKLIAAGKRPAQVEATLDRAEALRDADVVLTTILAGSTEIWRHDIEIPKKYGIDINVGDTRNVMRGAAATNIYSSNRTLPFSTGKCDDARRMDRRAVQRDRLRLCRH